MSPLIRIQTLSVACVFAAGLFSAAAHGQNAPFGGNAAAQGNAGPQTGTVADSPLTLQWMGYAAKGDLELAEAIAALARLKRWNSVNSLLGRVAGSDASEETLAEMSNRIGGRLFVAIKSEPTITDAARAGIDKLIKAGRDQAEAPDRLRKAIANLDSKTTDSSLAATRTLLRGGNAAIIELVGAAVQTPPPADRDQILRTMLSLGPGGPSALQQLALYGTPEIRTAALECLARIDRASYTVDFLTAALAEDASAEERTVGRESIAAIDGAVPSLASGRELLLINFHQSEQAAELTKNDDLTTVLWSVNQDRTGVTHLQTQRILASYRQVADAASRLRRIGGLTPSDASDVLAAEIGYRLMIDPDWGDPAQVSEAKRQYPILNDPMALQHALSHAMKTNDLPAAVGLLRIIDPASASSDDRRQFLIGSGTVRTPLVLAASSPEPRIRFEAAIKAAQLAGTTPVPGSSFVLRTLSEMNGLDNKPNAILVETRADTTMQAETLLSGIGFNVEVVRTVAALQRAIRRGGDLRIVLAKTQLADLPPIEMIDSVRRLDRGKQVPIVFYGPTGPDLGTKRWQAPTLWIDQPASVAELENLRRQVQQSRRIPQMTFLDRQTYQEMASELLAKRL